MNHWWRAYDEAVDDPKLQLVSDALFRTWFNIMCLCSANDGVVPPIEHVAFKLHTSAAKAAKAIEVLADANLLDKTEDGRWQPHNWTARQYKSDVSTGRVKQFRERRRNVSSNVSETPPDNRLQITETESKKDAANAAPAIDQEADLFRRGKEVLGSDSGGLIVKLRKAKNGSIPQARAAIEQASTKHNPREYVSRIANGPVRPTDSQGNPYPDGII